MEKKGLCRLAVLAVCTGLGSFATPAAGDDEGIPVTAINWCLDASASAVNEGIPSSTIREYPGVTCSANLGILVGDYGLKVPDCGALNRVSLLFGGASCDSISLIELNSDVQCHCACGIYDSPLEQSQCEANGWAPNDARCQACRGCGSGSGSGSCRQQAEVICPPDQYDIACGDGGNVVSPIGCDCTCKKKGPCALQAGACQYQQIRPKDPRCGANNSAGCWLCNSPAGPSTANCTMHPDHCADGGWAHLGFQSDTECLEKCSEELVTKVLTTISGYDIKTLAGDWNCAVMGNCILGPKECPFLDDLIGAGLAPCAVATYLNPLCALDAVFSNWCGCGGVFTLPLGALMDGNQNYDHPIIIHGSPHAYTHDSNPVVEAHSQRTCDGVTLSDGTSDFLGASCGVYGTLPSRCEGSGSTSRGMLMYKRPNDCPNYYQQFGYPKVLVCDQASVSASACCDFNASSQTYVRLNVEGAEATASASCSNGVFNEDPPLRVIREELDTALPLVIDGQESLVVTRHWSRQRGPTSCQIQGSGGPNEPPGEPVGVDMEP